MESGHFTGSSFVIALAPGDAPQVLKCSTDNLQMTPPNSLPRCRGLGQGEGTWSFPGEVTEPCPSERKIKTRCRGATQTLLCPGPPVGVRGPAVPAGVLQRPARAHTSTLRTVGAVWGLGCAPHFPGAPVMLVWGAGMSRPDCGGNVGCNGKAALCRLPETARPTE